MRYSTKKAEQLRKAEFAYIGIAYGIAILWLVGVFALAGF
jgi:hypothetical protein